MNHTPLREHHDISSFTSQELLHDRRICVIIPTYNNAGTIVDVVRRALSQCDNVIVVSDGSTDGSRQMLEETKGITLVAYEKNEGKGTALKRGFMKALEMGFTYAITLDGDGQHFPEDIPLLLEANLTHPGALIVGSRKGLESMERSGGSKFANSFSNFWFAIQTLHYLPDTQTGYRLYPLKRLSGLRFLTSRYESELELMVFASWAGVELVSQPVNVYYPPKEKRVSHFRPGPDFTRITILNTILCCLAGCYGYPRIILRAIMRLVRSAYSLIFFLLAMLIATPLIAIYMSVCTNKKNAERKKHNLHRILQQMSRFVLITHGIPGVKYSQSNPDGETFSKPSIIICNHQSHLDLMPLLLQSPKIVVLTNKWVWNNPFYGFLIRKAEFLPVYNGMDAIKSQLLSLVERGYSIAIYPEGTRSEDCSIKRFHQGAFALAEELNLDIVPIILYGAGKVLPKKGHALNKGKIHIDIDKRITPSELQSYGETAKEQASHMRKYYKRRYQQVANQLEIN